jgi:hypothetical protein
VTGQAEGSAASAARQVIETDAGITVYPARWPRDPWRATWYEDGERCYCQAMSEDRLAQKLVLVTERLTAGALNLARPGTDLIAYYLSPDRHPPGQQWSRKHADTQAYLCDRYLRPVITRQACQVISARHMQQVVNAAPTVGEGQRVHAMISALTSAGITGGYLIHPQIRDVHWQAQGRDILLRVAPPAGESTLWVEPDDIPADHDVAALGQAAAIADPLYELMVNFAAYTGLRWGELAALTIHQITEASRTVTVDRKVIDIRGHLFVELPKNRKRRRTIYPRETPTGWPLADMVAARIEAARQEQQAGTNPLGLIFPAPRGGYLRSSNFRRRVLTSAYAAAGWRDPVGSRSWTWHSLRHVFCTTALFTWDMSVTDVSRLAGHANHRITLEMYVGSTAGTIDRAVAATQ